MFEGDNPEILSICLLSLHRVEAVDILAQTAELSLNKQKSQQIDDNATFSPGREPCMPWWHPSGIVMVTNVGFSSRGDCQPFITISTQPETNAIFRF